MANGEGITFTTKELLSRIEDKVDKIDEKLDAKADVATVEALRIQMELLRETAVKRDGPLIKEYWEYTRATRSRVELLEQETLRREKYIPQLERTKAQVEVLESRSIRMLGGLSVLVFVIGVLATVNTIRLFVGI